MMSALYCIFWDGLKCGMVASSDHVQLIWEGCFLVDLVLGGVIFSTGNYAAGAIESMGDRQSDCV
jgi:hypothetical protein